MANANMEAELSKAINYEDKAKIRRKYDKMLRDAAPELLEACQRAFARLVYLTQDADPDDAEGNEAVCDLIQSAIAKAEGGAS